MTKFRNFLKKAAPLHPILFVLYPVLFFYAYNREELLPQIMLKPALLILLPALLLWLWFLFIFRSLKKSAIFISVFTFLFFSYGHLFSLIDGLYISFFGWFVLGPNKLLFGLFLCGLFFLFTFLLRAKKSLDNLNGLVGAIAIFLVLSNLVPSVIYELKEKRFFAKKNLAFGEEKLEVGRGIDPKDYPDIYYIILDRYASEQTLKDYLDFDNSDFLNFLKGKGFYVASESHANYCKTFESLASALNLRHLTYLSKVLGEDYTDRAMIQEMLQEHDVARFLKALGYNYVHFGDEWGPSRTNRYADFDINYLVKDPEKSVSILGGALELDEFAEELFAVSMATPIENLFSPKQAAPTVESSLEEKRRIAIEKKFEKIANLTEVRSPKFVFAHILMPHPPYMFRKDCAPLPPAESAQFTEEENYLNQLTCANSKTKLLVEKLLSNSLKPPVIILQSDEGPFVPEKYFRIFTVGGMKKKHFQYDLNKDSLKIHMSILNAYFLPGVEANVLYPSITPVNTFRVVFNLYFGQNLKLLKDKSYVFLDELYPYRFVDVTKKLLSGS